jgi:hypothetical protein
MMDHGLGSLVDELETRTELWTPGLVDVSEALTRLRPDVFGGDGAPDPEALTHADGAILVVDRAYPNWTVHIHGRANDRDGHWRCVLREGETRDNDRIIGSGRAPVLSQAILAAVLRLAAEDRGRPAGP